MLNASLEKLSKIGSPRSISLVARWLSQDVTSVEQLVDLASKSPEIKNTEVLNILKLFDSMKIAGLVDDKHVSGTGVLKDKFIQGPDIFTDWFIDCFIDFALENSIINIDTIQYSRIRNAFIMSSTTIKPAQHACYRNILTDYDVITLLEDCRYLVGHKLEKALKSPKHNRKVTLKQLQKQLEREQEQGERGELFVLEYEKKRLQNPERQSGVERISTIDVAAGFDIISFDSDDSVEHDRFIEVKTFKGSEHFHWSKNEIDAARLMTKLYYLYLVDDDCLDKEDYEPIIIQDPYQEIFESGRWNFDPESYKIEKIRGTKEDAAPFSEDESRENSSDDLVSSPKIPPIVTSSEESPVYFDQGACTKSDLVRVIHAMYEMDFFKKKNMVERAYKKDVFHHIGKALNFDLDDYSNYLNGAKNRNSDTTANSEIFEKLKKKSEQTLNGGEHES